MLQKNKFVFIISIHLSNELFDLQELHYNKKYYITTKLYFAA